MRNVSFATAIIVFNSQPTQNDYRSHHCHQPQLAATSAAEQLCSNRKLSNSLIAFINHNLAFFITHLYYTSK